MRQVPGLTELLVFGDSLSDGGNARAVLGDAAFPCPPHWNNRRCDGPLWVEQLAARLRVPPLVPSLAGGGNHAFGGARSGAGTTPKGLPNLLTQVDDFLGQGQGLWMRESPGPLVVLRAGANDYLDVPIGPAVGDAVNRHLLAAVNALADRGLRHFLVPSELPWGWSPIRLPGVGEPERRALNRLIARQNTALRQALAELAARRELRVFQPDFHGVFLQIQAQPGAWGFREVGRPVLGGGGLELGGALAGAAVGAAGAAGAGSPVGPPAVPDGQGFLWWDAWGHLTTVFHRVLAERAMGGLTAHSGDGWLGCID